MRQLYNGGIYEGAWRALDSPDQPIAEALYSLIIFIENLNPLILIGIELKIKLSTESEIFMKEQVVNFNLKNIFFTASKNFYRKESYKGFIKHRPLNSKPGNGHLHVQMAICIV